MLLLYAGATAYHYSPTVSVGIAAPVMGKGARHSSGPSRLYDRLGDEATKQALPFNACAGIRRSLLDGVPYKLRLAGTHEASAGGGKRDMRLAVKPIDKARPPTRDHDKIICVVITTRVCRRSWYTGWSREPLGYVHGEVTGEQ